MNYAPEVALKATFTMEHRRGANHHIAADVIATPQCSVEVGNSGGYRIVLFIKFALFVDNHNLVFGEVYDLNIALDMSLSLFKLKGFPVLGEDFVYISPTVIR